MRVFIAFLMLVLTVGVHGQAVSRNELKNTNTQIDARMALKANTTALVTASNAILALAPVTFATIADMIASSPATNLCYVKSHHGTNGLGGGVWRLGGTNGFKTNEWSVMGSTAPRMFWFRQDASPIRPEWFGAVPDIPGDSLDDTAALQAFCNAHTNGYVISQWPPGDFRHNQTLAITNHSASSSFRMLGVGAGRGPDGTRLIFTGSLGATQIVFVGANNSWLESIAVDCNSLAKVGILIDSENIEKPGSPGSSKMRLRNVVISAPVGAGSLAISISHSNALTPQVSEIYVEHCDLQGTTGSDIGIKNHNSGNTKNIHLLNCTISGFTNGVNFSSFDIVHIDGTDVNCQTNFIIVGSGGTLRNSYSEGAQYFGAFHVAGANAATMVIENITWNGVTVGSDEIMRVSGRVVLIGNRFRNNRTGTSLPVIAVSASGSGSAVLSVHNFYRLATVTPIYFSTDITETNYWVFNREGVAQYAHTNRPFNSIGDYGGEEGSLVFFEDHKLNGGDLNARYLEVFGSGVWYSNKLGAGTLNPTNTLDVAGNATVRGNLHLPVRGSNAVPDAYMAVKGGVLVDAPIPAGGAGSGSVTTLKENGSQVGDADIVTLDFLGADFDLTESPDTEVNIVIAAAIARDAELVTGTNDAYAYARLMTNGVVNTNVGAGLLWNGSQLSATGTPFYRPNWTTIYTNFAIGSDSNIWIDMDRSYILSVTNVCNGCKVHVVLTNSGAYNYSWYNVAGSTNRIEWQNEAAPVSTAPATDAGLYSVYLQGTATNVMGWYYPPRGTANIVAKTVTTSGGITNTSASAAIESAAGFRATRAAGSATPGEVSIDSTNGFVLSIQAGLMGSNVYFFAPTNVPVGLTDPVLTVSNLVHGAGGWTGTLAFASRSVLLNGAQPTNTILTQLAGLLATNQIVFTNDQWLLTRGSNGVVVAITGPSFATVSSSGSGGVQTFTLTASAALGNWQGNPYVAYTNIPVTTATTVNGAGNGSTNYLLTLSSIVGSVNSFNLGSSNVNIYTVAGSTLGSPIAWRAAVTNLSANNWGIRFDSLTNRWRFSGVYGTNAPTVLTNGTALWLAGESDGTNTVVGYTYFAPGL